VPVVQQRLDKTSAECLHAAGVLSPDGLPRFVWTDDQPDPTTYALSLLHAIAERQRWRAEYDRAKAAAGAVDNHSATGPPPNPGPARSSASPDPGQTRADGPTVKGERSESSGPSASEALHRRNGGPHSPQSGEAEPPTTRWREPLRATGEQEMTMTERLLSLTDLAEFLSVPVTTLYQWRHRGEGPPGYRIGRHVRYRRAEVEAWLATQTDDYRSASGF
jgi:excisionase family DNA binding protein